MFLVDTGQLMFLHEHQRAVLRWIASRFGMCFIVTSLYRMGDPGVHGTLPLRGTDLRCHSTEIGKAIKDSINAHWKYDPERPYKKVCRSHGPEIGAPLHLHVQTHPRTYEV